MDTVWAQWLQNRLYELESANLNRTLRPLTLRSSSKSEIPSECISQTHNLIVDVEWKKIQGSRIVNTSIVTFDKRGQWDYDSVHAYIPAEPCDSRGRDHSKERELILFSGNDYLGLSCHPSVRNAAANAALNYGMGPRSSALVTGYSHLHQKLENELASLCKSEECVLCPTGFSANLSVMSAVASSSSNDELAIFSDELNHASIIDGVRLAQRNGNTNVKIYKHNDMAHLESLLMESDIPRKLVVTDSVFSMDGDFADMVELSKLKSKYNFLLVADEAHATLVCGSNGSGVCEMMGLDSSTVDIHVGTLSKAVGVQGGFICCSKSWKALIVSRGRAFIYSTAATAPVVAAALASLEVAKAERWRQVAVWGHVRQLSQLLGMHFSSPICPVIIGGAEQALLASSELLRLGFHVPAIRPPTVPDNSSRLRVTLSASHSSEDVAQLARALLPFIAPNNSKVQSLEKTHSFHSSSKECRIELSECRKVFPAPRL